jgi:hypothetical protein
MQIKTWHVVLFLTLTSCALVIAEIPRDTWLTSAALSLALGVAAVAMMGAAALLGSRWKIMVKFQQRYVNSHRLTRLR